MRCRCIRVVSSSYGICCEDQGHSGVAPRATVGGGRFLGLLCETVLLTSSRVCWALRRFGCRSLESASSSPLLKASIGLELPPCPVGLAAVATPSSRGSSAASAPCCRWASPLHSRGPPHRCFGSPLNHSTAQFCSFGAVSGTLPCFPAAALPQTPQRSTMAARAAGPTSEEADTAMEPRPRHGGAPGSLKKTREAVGVRAAPATSVKRTYARRAATAAPVEVSLATAESCAMPFAPLSSGVSEEQREPHSTAGAEDLADGDDQPVREVYEAQHELSAEETARQTSLRLALPLYAVRFVLAQAKKGATVPFLARYRQGETGRMDETQLRLVMDTSREVMEVHRRRQFMLRSLESRGLLTSALKSSLESMVHLSQLEDAWEPYKERRTSLASRGRAAGLGPFAVALLKFNPDDPDCTARLDGLSSMLRRTQDGERLLTSIIAEDVQRDEDVRHRLGEYCRLTARLSCSVVGKPRKKAAKGLREENFEALRKHFAYYDGKTWSVQRIAAHIVLALQRGEAKGVLTVETTSGPRSHGLFLHAVRERYPSLNRWLPGSSTPSSGSHSASAGVHTNASRDYDYGRNIMRGGIQAAYENLMRLAHVAIRRDLKKSAERAAIVVFAHNVQHMLLQRPLSHARILAMDPGLTNGVKCVVLDERGTVETFFTCTLMDEPKMRRSIVQVVETRRLNKVVIGNGTASRRTAELVADLIHQQKWEDVEFAVVSEAGASVYSVSDIAKEEFPNLDVMYRGAISIGRRVLDPLSELVKIPVRSMGIGMYQHDINEKELTRELNYVLESCVAKVGINATTAHRYVMEKVPGIHKKVVDQIVLARHAKRLHSRADLRQVPAMTESVYEQVAGFFRFPNSPEPLDNTNLHPESYAMVRRLVHLIGTGQLGGSAGGGSDDGGGGGLAVAAENPTAWLKDAPARQHVAQLLAGLSPAQLATLASKKLACTVETLQLVQRELLHPGLDPRASLPHAGLLRREVCDVNQLRSGQLVSGVVQSVTMFGAFVDCGFHDAVLVRGDGVDTLQVGMYLDQKIRFEGFDHLHRPRMSLECAVDVPSKVAVPPAVSLSRRLRLESEDVLGSGGGDVARRERVGGSRCSFLSGRAEPDAAVAPSASALVSPPRQPHTRDDIPLNDAEAPLLSPAAGPTTRCSRKRLAMRSVSPPKKRDRADRNEEKAEEDTVYCSQQRATTSATLVPLCSVGAAVVTSGDARPPLQKGHPGPSARTCTEKQGCPSTPVITTEEVLTSAARASSTPSSYCAVSSRNSEEQVFRF